MTEPINPQVNPPGQHVNENFTSAFHGSSEILQEPQVDMVTAAYSLSELEYYKIVKCDNSFIKYTWQFFVISAGYIVIVFAKFLGNAKIENWEIISPIVAIVLYFITRKIVDRFFPGDNRKVLSKIQKYFEQYRPTYEPHHKKR